MLRKLGMPLIVGVMIMGFMVVMAISFVELRSIGRTLQNNTGENLLWLVSRSNYEAQRLALLLERGGPPDDPDAAFDFRLDMLRSRLDVALAQTQRQFFEDINALVPYENMLQAVACFDQVLEDVDPVLGPDASQLPAFRDSLDMLISNSNMLANAAMLGEREAMGRHFDDQTSAMRSLVVASLSIFFLGLAMGGQLLRLLRQKNRAAQELAAHRDCLEAIVAERTQALNDALVTERHAKNAYRSFISTVSHQFRTPLAVISIFSQRLTKRALQFTPAQVVEKSERITAATVRLIDLLNSVTNAVAVDQNEIILRRKPCDLRDTVSAAMTAIHEGAPHRQITFDRHQELPPCLCDPILIEQIIHNMLSNAVKYSAGSQPINIRLWQQDAKVFCEVQDHGIGIPAPDQERIFERFHRGTNAANIFGSGLGLNLSRDIAAMHGGGITFHSREGEGSRFTLFLPLAPTPKDVP